MSDIIPQKPCRKCGQILPATPVFFQRNCRMRDGLLNHCKTCCSTAKPKEAIPEGYQRCSKCKELKPATSDFFYSHRSPHATRYALDSWCIACAREKREQQRRSRMVVPRVPQVPSEPEGWKRCHTCQEIKTVDQFPQRSGRAHGQCKQCRTSAQKSRMKVPQGPSKCCKECLRDYPATSEFFPKSTGNPDGLDVRCRPCFNTWITCSRRHKRSHINQKQRDYRAANRTHYNAQAMVSYHKRKARKAGSGGSYTLREIAEQLVRQKHTCYYCQAPFEKVSTQAGDIIYRYHIEHVVPIARGGRNDISNIVLACPTCNLHKHDKLPHEWPEGGRLL